MDLRHQIAGVIDRLLAGDLDRESASLWAVEQEAGAKGDPIATDALDLLMIIDAWQVNEHSQPSEYMYDLGNLLVIRRRLEDEA